MIVGRPAEENKKKQPNQILALLRQALHTAGESGEKNTKLPVLTSTYCVTSVGADGVE